MAALYECNIKLLAYAYMVLTNGVASACLQVFCFMQRVFDTVSFLWPTHTGYGQ